MVDFSLRSDLTNISFVTIDDGFRLFNCSTHTRYINVFCMHKLSCLLVVVVLAYHPIICVGGVYMIRSVPHPVISVTNQLIGSMLVWQIIYYKVLARKSLLNSSLNVKCS